MHARRVAARRLIKHCCFALLLVLCAQGLRWLVGLRFPMDQHFLFYHFAVIWAALMWGLFPGLIAVAASTLAAGMFHQAAPQGLIAFAASGIMTTAVASWARARWVVAKGLASSDSRRLGQIVNALPELVAYIDTRHRYQFNNQMYERWFGIASDEIRGRHVRDVLGERAYDVVRPHLEKALGGEEVHYEAYVPYKDGGERYIEARYVPHRDRPGGPVAGVGVLVSDASERRRAEEQATIRTRQQEAVARLGQEALTTRDIDALMSLAVREVCRVLGNEFGIILERAGEEGWRPRAVVGWDLTPGERMPADFPRPAHSTYTLEHNEPIIVENARDEKRFRFPDETLALGIASGISVVVSGDDGRPWGTLTTHATRPRGFTQDDIHFMQAVAHVLSEAMRRHETEQSLRESEGRFRMMADTAPVMIWMAGPENEGVYFNRPWLDFTGRVLQEELGFGWLETIHPDDRDRATEECQEAFDRRLPVKIEFRMRRYDGAWRWVLDHGVPHFSPRGRFLGYIGSTVDINGLREAERDLQRRLEQLSAIYHVSDVAGKSSQIEEIFEAALTGLRRALRAERASILLFDPDGVMRFKAWSGLSDAYRAKTQGHSPWTKDTVDPAPVLIPDAAAGDLGELRDIILCEGIRALGFIPLVASGRLIGKFMIYHDAPHHFTEEELRLANTIGRHVAAAVERHRVDQDLRTLNETLEMRVRERTRESERRSVQLRALALDLIETEERERRLLAQSLHDDLQQILVATRMKIGRLQDHEDPATLQPVQELLHEALQSSRRITVDLSPPILFEAGLIPALQWLVRHMRDKYGLEVYLEGPGDVEVSSERHRAFLFRAARELLFNIVKHAGVGTAQILLERDGPDAVAMEVRDQGSGFAATELEVSGGATGFGLFSIQERAEALGGHMNLKSEPGGGTRVRLVLGVREAVSELERIAHVPEPAAPVASIKAGGKGNGSGRIRVLLADDHKIVREGLAALLSTQDDIETVAQAADGEEAVTLAMRLKPDVVVMDVSMPGLSGIEATRRITAQAPSIKVIGLSMFESEEMSLSMRTAGASCYLTKDRASETLCDVIRTEGRAGA